MKPIGDYAIIGDGRSSALVSRDGSIDWLCWPRVDGPSLFGALLDARAGSWSVRPAGGFRSTRRYLDRTNVLETRFESDRGVVRLTDLMPVASEEARRRRFAPEHEIVRFLQVEAGTMDFEIRFDPRYGYGRGRPAFRRAGRLGLRAEFDASVLHLNSGLDWTAGDDGAWIARVSLGPGGSLSLSLTLAHDGPAIVPPVGEWTRERISESIAWWRRWMRSCSYDGPGRDEVIRSALALKLIAYAPSGAILAAPTTSLPERIGGDLNWDYRYCWLRDASLTARALFGLGFKEEGEAFVSWLLHSTRLSRRRLRILYDVFGNSPGREKVLDHLDGYEGSRPVRVGNAAEHQLQLDVYGEVLEAVAHFESSGGELDRETARMVRRFGRIVRRRWREPDEGLWEPRSGPAPHTHSRLLCWTALDRLIDLGARGLLPGAPLTAFGRERDRIRREIETRAWNASKGCYTGRLDGDDVDAAVLLMPWYGFEEAGSPRMRMTYERIRSELGAGGALLYRNRSGDAPGEGAFGIASFWGVEFLALGGGELHEAMEAFEELLGYANDVGLYAEEIDPATGAALGNFPQGFTHIGLVNAALSLDRRLRAEPPVRRSVADRRATVQESEAVR